jgi:nucleotide-binding universal stress UspA family protein
MGQIVVGYDGSDNGRAALDAAVELARGLGDTVVLVFGYAPPGIWGGEIAEHAEAIEEFGQKVMGDARQATESAGIEIEHELVAKRPAEAVAAVSEARDARMIVVGSHGEAPLKGAILGSTPYKLLHQAERPVLVVPAR